MAEVQSAPARAAATRGVKARAKDDPVTDFVEQMGLLCEAEQMPRIAGRLFGLFLVENGTFSLSELAKRLRVSRASVSTNTRMLADVGFLERVGIPGDRRDYYRLASSPFERMLSGMIQRMTALGDFLGESARRFPPERAEAKERLVTYAAFHQVVADAMRNVSRLNKKTST